MFAAFYVTDYAKNPIFRTNFWAGFKKTLGANHTIQNLDKCDFHTIYKHLLKERARKQALPKEDRIQMKKLQEERESSYKVAFVNGKEEAVGNFRIEPPGLFRGRGDHPLMGTIKRRIYPEDVTINIGVGEPIPKHPYPGRAWKNVIHDNTVTWLAKWSDTVIHNDVKYVFLAVTSAIKTKSDFAKYEKARALKKMIRKIRANYERDLRPCGNPKQREIATAMYLVDRLALRVGHEKSSAFEADTVGTCTLKVKHLQVIPPAAIKLKFLGKDSICYENTTKVAPNVYANLKEYTYRKNPDGLVFNNIDAVHLNRYLNSIMDGLSAKVFRTYNASVTLDRLLSTSQCANMSIPEKLAIYERANKHVAVLCNHQRAISKSHSKQVKLLKQKIKELQKRASKYDDPKAQEQITKLNLKLKLKDEMKTIALGTSRANYMDPRITVAWCKRCDVPLEKVFSKTLISKFNWALDSQPSFTF
jgi:DNA topoisomerase-1